MPEKLLKSRNSSFRDMSMSAEVPKILLACVDPTISSSQAAAVSSSMKVTSSSLFRLGGSAV